MKACRCVNSYKIMYISISAIKVYIVFGLCNSKLFFSKCSYTSTDFVIVICSLVKNEPKKNPVLAKMLSNLNSNTLLVEMSIDTALGRII